MTHPLPSSDADIIAAIRAGGANRTRCENALYTEYAYLVWRRPRKYKLSDDEARDAYTEAFLAVVDHIVTERFRGESSIKTYLSRIFRNKCVDQHRKNTTNQVAWTETFPDLPDTSRDFVRQLVGKESLEVLKQHIARLGERCQEILMLAGQGYKPAEIAEQLGFKTAHSASSQRYKCLTKLKALIAGREIFS
ncbi:MAG: sigma-70 family RNA polymerase sigma factor [Bacteroidota bacterium]